MTGQVLNIERAFLASTSEWANAGDANTVGLSSPGPGTDRARHGLKFDTSIHLPADAARPPVKRVGELDGVGIHAGCTHNRKRMTTAKKPGPASRAAQYRSA